MKIRTWATGKTIIFDTDEIRIVLYSGQSLISLSITRGGGGGGGGWVGTPPIHIKAKPENHTYSYILT